MGARQCVHGYQRLPRAHRACIAPFAQRLPRDVDGASFTAVMRPSAQTKVRVQRGRREKREFRWREALAQHDFQRHASRAGRLCLYDQLGVRVNGLADFQLGDKPGRVRVRVAHAASCVGARHDGGVHHRTVRDARGHCCAHHKFRTEHAHMCDARINRDEAIHALGKLRMRPEPTSRRHCQLASFKVQGKPPTEAASFF